MRRTASNPRDGATRVWTSVDGTCTSILAKGEIIEAVVLKEQVGRRVHRLSRDFDIPIHHFYKPVMIPGRTDKTVQ